MGYKAVAISSSDSKRDLAGRLGASHYIDSSKETPAQALQALGGAKLVVCAAPNEKVISEVLMGLSPNATLLIVALQAASISIPICQYLFWDLFFYMRNWSDVLLTSSWPRSPLG